MLTPADDPLISLEHDHAELHRCVVELSTLVRAVREQRQSADEVRPALIDLLSVLSEDVFAHFAREEEVLFPFAMSAVPDLSDLVMSLTLAHDGVCGALSRLGRLVQNEGYAAQFSLVAAMAERFADTYAEHARLERSLLSTLATRLTPEQRREIVELARGI